MGCNTTLLSFIHCPDEFLSMSAKSHTSTYRKQLAAQICDHNFVLLALCDFCVLNHKPCFQMSDNNNKLKCAECTCHGKSCVSLSWELLNMTQDNLCKDLAFDEAKWDALVEQLAKLQACVS